MAGFPLEPSRFDAVAFDLDGVVTRTAEVHAAAWKRTFDALLASRANGGSWQPFDEGGEYRRHVDGKPRRDGIRGFLEARGIALPEGSPDDPPEADTIHGLAARKQRDFLAQLDERGVEVHADAVRLLARVRERGLQTAVVSASENCGPVVEAAGLADQFDVRVDGLDIQRCGLRGKPAPDTFVEATRRLGTVPARCVVLEDAIVGVQAGRAGDFGLVIGVDRGGDHAEALRRGGADLVVTTLDDLELGGEPRETRR